MRQRSTLPTTSAPPVGLFEESTSGCWESGSRHRRDAGRKLSATYDVARQAAERVGNGRVSVVDSGQTTMCLGWLAMRAPNWG